MKNLKVRNKLWVGFGTIITLTLLISVLSVFCLNRLKEQTDLLISKTLKNTEYVWQIRRDTLSATRYFLMALSDDDPEEVEKYIKLAEEDANSSQSVFKAFESNYRVEKRLIDDYKNTLGNQAQIRQKFITLLRDTTPSGLNKAANFYEDKLMPILSQQGEILKEIHDQQIDLSQKQINKTIRVYYFGSAIIIIMNIIAMIISFIMIKKLMKGIITPLTAISNATNALAEGDFSVSVDYDSKDEFGVTCKSIQSSFTELKRIINSTAYTLKELAKGNFALDTNMDFHGEMKEIEQAQAELIQKMNVFFSEINASSNQIHVGADQVSGGAQALAQGSTEQASSLQELADAISVISENVQNNAQNSKKANDLATESGEVAQTTLQDMQNMLSAMDDISKSAENIGKVIKVIDDLAFQTNILSLNAAVEAARVGPAGKGFAVVADEVRNLSRKSAESAKEITELIEKAIASANNGEIIAQKTNEVFNVLVNKINNVVSTINEIAVASEEQSDNIKQINVGIDQISSVVQTNSATSEESAAASEELSGQANILNSMVKQFKLAETINNDTSYFEEQY